MKLDTELNGKPLKKLPLCGIYALHVHTQIPIKILFESYKTKFKKSNNWKGVSSVKNLSALLNDLPVKHSVCKLTAPIQVKALDTHYSNKLLIIRIPGHFLASCGRSDL